jgi:hypothetical protein
MALGELNAAGGSLNIAFEGHLLGLAGWFLLLCLSVLSIIGWPGCSRLGCVGCVIVFEAIASALACYLRSLHTAGLEWGQKLEYIENIRHRVNLSWIFCVAFRRTLFVDTFVLVDITPMMLESSYSVCQIVKTLRVK